MTKNIIEAALKETKDKKDLKNIHAVQLMKDEVPLIFVLGASIRKVHEKLWEDYGELNSDLFNLVKEYNYSIFEDSSDLGYLEFLLKLYNSQNKEAVSFVSFYETMNLIQAIALFNEITLDYDKIIAYFDSLINTQKEFEINTNDTEFVLEEFKKKIKKGF